MPELSFPEPIESWCIICSPFRLPEQVFSPYRRRSCRKNHQTRAPATISAARPPLTRSAVEVLPELSALPGRVTSKPGAGLESAAGAGVLGGVCMGLCAVADICS